MIDRLSNAKDAQRTLGFAEQGKAEGDNRFASRVEREITAWIILTTTNEHTARTQKDGPG